MVDKKDLCDLAYHEVESLKLMKKITENQTSPVMKVVCTKALNERNNNSDVWLKIVFQIMMDMGG